MPPEMLMPQDIEAERILLGNILLHPPALFEAQEHLHDYDFFSEAHQIIFRTMLAIQQSGEIIDILSIKNTLRSTERLERCGGIPYIASLTEGMSRTVSTAHYAKTILDHSLRRQLIVASQDAIDNALESEESTKAIMDNLQSALLKMSKGQSSGWKDINSLIKSSYETIERIVMEKKSLTGLDTGFNSLNAFTKGFHPGELIILAGRPGHGKSSFASNIVDHMILRCGKSVGVFSLEMSGEELSTRSLLSEAEVDSYEIHRIDRYGLGADIWNRLHDSCGSFYGKNLWIDDTGGLNIQDVSGRAKRLKLEHDIDFIVVDYLQLMSGTGTKHVNREREISEISRGLKMLAKELYVPIMALSQLNRSIENTERRPQLSDLRESGSIEQDADVVMFIWREELRKWKPENAGEAELIIGKQRGGRCGTIGLRFQPKYTKFYDV